MAPEGHERAMAAVSSAGAPSGWIHSPGALGTNTSGRPSTQLREGMHFLPAKRTRMFLPRYSCTASLMDASAGGESPARRAPVGDRLGVAYEAEVDGRHALLFEVFGLEPARLLPRLPRGGAEARAPALDEPEGGRQQHQRADARVELGDAAGQEAAQARSEEHGPIVLVADGRARGRDHRGEAQVLERRQAQVEAIHRQAARVE